MATKRKKPPVETLDYPKTIQKAQFLVDNNQHEEALKLLGKLTKQLGTDNDFNILQLQGVAYIHTKDFLSAAQTFERVLVLRPTLPRVALNLGIAYHFAGLYQDCANLMEKWQHSKELQGNLLQRWGESLLMLGDKDKALTVLERAYEVSPLEPEVIFSYGSMLASAGNYEKAEHIWRKHPNSHKSNLLFSLGYRYAIACIEGNEETKDYAKSILEKHSPHILDSLTYWEQQVGDDGKHVPIFWDYKSFFEHVLTFAPKTGLNMEFGVRFGHTLRMLAGFDESQLWHGFDSFQGIPEAWGDREAAGTYSTQGNLPPVQDTVTLHVGWFEDTLKPFAAEHAKPVRFMNIDCDIYSSTVTILTELKDHIKPGSVVVFDEYIMNPNWRQDEFKAWKEAVAANGWDYKYIGFSFRTKQVAVQVIEN